MSEACNIPNGWAETTFGAVVENVSINDKKLPKGKYEAAGRFPVVDQGQRFIGGYTDDETKVISNDLPLLVFGDHTRVFKYLDQPFVPGADGVKVLKPLGVNARWLYQIAHALDFPDKGYARHYQHLKIAQLFVPPLDEQRRIVAEIEKQFTRLEAAVAALRRVQANLRRYRAAVLKSACEGLLVPTEAELCRQKVEQVEQASPPASADQRFTPLLGYETGEQLLQRILEERRRRFQEKMRPEGRQLRVYKEPVAPDTSNLPALPEGWTWAALDAISEAVGGFAFSSSKFTEDGYLVVKMANVRMGLIDLLNRPSFIKGVSSDTVEKYGLRVGDLVVTLTGTRKKQDYGYVALITHQKDLLLNQRIARVRPCSEVSSAYLQIAMQAEDYRNRFFAHETGNVGQGNVGMVAVTTEAVALPPLAEQTRIVAEVERRLSLAEELEAVVTANLQRATRLRQSILQKAFTGQL